VAKVDGAAASGDTGQVKARVIGSGHLLVAALLHACYQPPADIDCTVRCAPTTLACPDGFDCANGRCYLAGNPACGGVVADAPLEGGADDLDADGSPDVTDNCLGVFNPSQRDEDDDGRGDLCDACIGFPDCPGGMATCTQPDVDDDGVGDACDRTATLATTVMLKYGVDGGGPSADWVRSGGSWGTSVYSGDGSPEWFGIGPTGDANYLLGPGLTPTGVDLTVEVGFRATSTNANSTISVWTSVDDFLLPPNGGQHCGPSAIGGLQFRMMERVGVQETTLGSPSPAQQALTVVPYRMWARIGSTSVQCGELNPAWTLSVNAGLGTDPRRIGLHAAQATVEFDYVIIYADPAL